MNYPTLFPIKNLVQKKKPHTKVKYSQGKTVKQRYNLTERVRKAGIKIDAKNRTIDGESMKHADPTTRKRINHLLKHGFGIENKLFN